jgi:hypothetical protein
VIEEQHMVLTMNSRWAILLVVLSVAGWAPAQEKEAQRLSAAEIEKLHRTLKPQRGEARWMEVTWHPNVWEARQKAAAEGKPLFIWAGSGGAPAAGC